MKRIIKYIILGVFVSAIFTCISYANPVRSYLIPDEYAQMDSAESFTQLYNYCVSQEDDNSIPVITNLKKVDTKLTNSNVYMGDFGDYSSIVFQEDASNNRLMAIAVATPDTLFSDSYLNEYGTEPASQFITEVSTLEGFFGSMNEIDNTDNESAAEKSIECITNGGTGSFCAGNLRYDINCENNAISYTLSAYTDDGK
ncbi:MAG: hypothetical protein LKJ25_03425 [Clostridia bacterium]|jgi:hypothetical protein|nr:hypothetical protein [Clostridia bacterium]